MIGLRAGQPERPLLEDRVTPVPKGQREAQPLLDVTKAGEPVLAPAVRARARVVVRQIVPGVPVGAVVFADCAPLPFAEVRAPQIPVAGLVQTKVEATETLIRCRSAPAVVVMSLAVLLTPLTHTRTERSASLFKRTTREP